MPQFKEIAGRQRAVWVQPGGTILSEGDLAPVDVVIVETGYAIIKEWYLGGDDLVRFDITAPIIDLPTGVQVSKVVAAGWPSSFSAEDDAVKFGWAVDGVDPRIDPGPNVLMLVFHAAALGYGGNLARIGYHVTMWLAGEGLGDEAILRQLEAG